MEVSIEIEKEEEKEYGKYSKWEVQSWADAILQAEEIKADPEKMKYVKMCMKKKYGAAKKAIESIDDIRAARAEMGSEDEEEYATED